VAQTVPVSPALWTGAAGDGNFFNPANWAQGIVPRNVGGQEFSLTIPMNTQVANSSANPVRVAGFIQQRNSTFELARNASVEVTQSANLSGLLSVTGPDSSFVALQSSVQLVGAPQLFALAGGTIAVAAEQFSLTADPLFDLPLLIADGADSVLDLSSLESLEVDFATDETFVVAATNGGTMDLSSLATLSGVTGGTGRLALRAETGGTIRVGNLDVFDQAGIQADGTDSVIDVDGNLEMGSASQMVLSNLGTVRVTGRLFNSGRVSGTGTLGGLVVNDGVFAPGDSPGEIIIDGDLDSTGNAVYEIEIGGPVPATQHDKVSASHSILLDGDLHVTLIDGGMGIYEPVKGDEFDLFTASAGLDGQFNSVSLPILQPPLGWRIAYNPTVVSLLVTPRLPGDFDADGNVDRSDMAIWQQGVGMLDGASQTDGDGDGDLDVDGDDLLDALLVAGSSSASALVTASTAVPEPGTFTLIGLFLALTGGQLSRKERTK
jgi:hypothetical protein